VPLNINSDPIFVGAYQNFFLCSFSFSFLKSLRNKFFFNGTPRYHLIMILNILIQNSLRLSDDVRSIKKFEYIIIYFNFAFAFPKGASPVRLHSFDKHIF
jgi:hypothetical protein